MKDETYGKRRGNAPARCNTLHARNHFVNDLADDFTDECDTPKLSLHLTGNRADRFRMASTGVLSRARSDSGETSCPHSTYGSPSKLVACSIPQFFCPIRRQTTNSFAPPSLRCPLAHANGRSDEKRRHPDREPRGSTTQRPRSISTSSKQLIRAPPAPLQAHEDASAPGLTRS